MSTYNISPPSKASEHACSLMIRSAQTKQAACMQRKSRNLVGFCTKYSMFHRNTLPGNPSSLFIQSGLSSFRNRSGKSSLRRFLQTPIHLQAGAEGWNGKLKVWFSIQNISMIPILTGPESARSAGSGCSWAALCTPASGIFPAGTDPSRSCSPIGFSTCSLCRIPC